MTKIVTTQNPKYVEALNELWNAAEDMLTYSSEPLKELYRLASIVGFFARQANKIVSFRGELGEAQAHRDIATLRRLQRKVQHLSEEKAFDFMWERISSRYDTLLKQFLDNSSNDDLLLQIPTAEEIFEKSAKATATADKKELDNLVQIIKAEIDL